MRPCLSENGSKTPEAGEGGVNSGITGDAGGEVG